MRDSALTQQALFNALNGAVEIADFLGPIHVADELDPDYNRGVPPEMQRPYIVIGESTEEPSDTHDGFGSIETCTIHTWSREKKSVVCKRIMAATDVLLHQRTLEIEEGRNVRVVREFAEVFKEEVEAGDTWRHGVGRYKVRTLNLRPLEVDEYA